MKKENVRQLREEAQKAVDKGKWGKAVEIYGALAAAQPAEALWPHRAGEALRKLGDKPNAIVALRKAADLYSAQGFMLKAIAVCRIILEIVPGHAETQELLTSLSPRRTPTAPQPAPAPTPPRSPTVPPGARIGDTDLTQALGAKPTNVTGELGVAELTLDQADEADIDALLAGVTGDEEAPAPPKKTLPATPLFASLDGPTLGWLVERAQFRVCQPGETVDSEHGEALYVIVSGTVTVQMRGRPVETLGEGTFFGENGLVADLPRRATVAVEEPTELLVLPAEVLRELIDRQPEVLRTLIRMLRDRLVARLMRTSPLFESFAADEQQSLARRFKFLEVGPGVRLVHQGERSLGLFVLIAGRVDVQVEAAGDSAKVADLGPGDIFGEISLLTGGPAIASILTAGKCWMLMLSRDSFQELIVTNPQVLIYANELAEKRKTETASITTNRTMFRDRSVVMS